MAKNKDKESEENEKQYIYIIQASNEKTKCKVGKTNNLNRRLKQYNSRTGVSKDVIFQYLFTCEVENMEVMEKAIKEKYTHLREEERREMYFYNPTLFKDYVAFIKSHNLYIEEIFIKPVPPKQITKIVAKRGRRGSGSFVETKKPSARLALHLVPFLISVLSFLICDLAIAYHCHYPNYQSPSCHFVSKRLL